MTVGAKMLSARRAEYWDPTADAFTVVVWPWDW